MKLKLNMVLFMFVISLFWGNVSHAAKKINSAKAGGKFELIKVGDGHQVFNGWTEMPRERIGQCSCKIVASVDMECVGRNTWDVVDHGSSYGAYGEAGQNSTSFETGVTTQNANGDFVHRATVSGSLVTGALVQPNTCRTDLDCQAYCAQTENFGSDGIPDNLDVWMSRIQGYVDGAEYDCNMVNGTFSSRDGHHMTAPNGTPLMCSYQIEGNCN